MRNFSKALSAIFFILMLTVENAQAGNEDEAAVAKREHDWRVAWVMSDYKTLEGLHATDYYAINNEGHFTTRKQVLSDVFAGRFKYTSMEHKDMRIRVYGNTAVVTGLTINKGHRGERDVSGVFAYTRIYVKENGIWQAVLAQYTRPQ
ncbi:DUF4440 domain-containing protein [Enterobacteriaceae bacterium RIT693]|nr:DUF4440 domain-containing protein [Enterobacteriaceae bacterium RIT693]